MGNTEVDQPKGIEVVKEGIRKMKFSEHLKRAEGSRPPKVELTISVDGVAIQDSKTKKIFHQYPLHRISYCADDKSDKKFFSFIAKEADTDRHSCFVFVSDKLSEEITLTIGQAFDLAYRRFLETSGKDLEMRKQLMLVQKRVRELEKENSELKAKLNEGANDSPKQKNGNSVKPNSMSSNAVTDKTLNGDKTLNNQMSPVVPLQPPPSALPRTLNRSFSANQSVNLLDIDIQPAVGRKLENLSLEDMEDFNPRAEDCIKPINGVTQDKNGALNGNGHIIAKDVFGCEPLEAAIGKVDPFGMGSFGTSHELDSAIGAIDKKLAEMRVS